MSGSEETETTRTSLTAEDWDARYSGADTPWDIGAVSPPLAHFRVAGKLPSGRRVLIPGCGAGHEVRYLAEAGYDAVGADYSLEAVERARLQLAGIANAAVICADLLADPPQEIEAFDWAFDQTFFCAILPSQRSQYARSMARWLRPGGELWALSFRVPTPGGPPFDSTPEEYVALLSPAGFVLVEQLALNNESHPARRGRETLVRMRLGR